MSANLKKAIEQAEKTRAEEDYIRFQLEQLETAQLQPGEQKELEKEAEMLALIGNADFDGKIVQVQSADGFLDEKTPVVITRVIDGQVWVKRTENLI